MANYLQQRKSSADDYCAYVKRLERKTSMCDGPHFPNLFKKMQAPPPPPPQNQKSGKMYVAAGRFGRAGHVEYETSNIKEEEEEAEVEVDAGEYVKGKHYSLRTVRGV